MEDKELRWIPAPRHVRRLPGTMVLRNGAQITLDVTHVEHLLGTAERLRDAVARYSDAEMQIWAGQEGDLSDVGVAIEIDPHRVESEQGYWLDVSESRASIVGHDAAGAFYGVCTLVQLVRQFGGSIPCLSVRDHPDFAARGVMLDVSRCKVPTLQTLMPLVDMVAGLKVNQLQLYTEHTFAYREHKEAWLGASPLSGEDILELDAYCRQRFVELVPNQNRSGTFASGWCIPSTANWLRHPTAFPGRGVGEATGLSR